MENFLIKYGLFAVFFGSMVEADAMPVMSGAVAHLGYFGFAGAIAASGGGMFAGDCVFYWLGRGFGHRIEKTEFYQKHLPKAEKFIGKIGVWQILAARVIYGTRNATMLFWGIKKFSFLKFAAIDFLGCLVWGTLLTALGYFLSFGAGKIIGDIKRIEIGLLVIIILAVSVILLIKFLKNKPVGGKE
jgi:membrane protein DedA with SNARE-associated domain